jgi:xanthine dehydrogenase/oxidase
VKFKNKHYPVIIAATHIAELSSVTHTEDGIRIGASVTLTQLDNTLKETVKHLKGNTGF